MSIVRRSIVTSAATLGVLFGAFLLCSAPALAAAPEKPDLTVEAKVPSPPLPSTEAVLHGILNPLKAGELGTYEFLYKVGATCVSGAPVPIPPGTAMGGVHEEVTETLTGLTPNTEYTVCLVVHNSVPLEAVSTPVTFTTALAPEKPETIAVTANTTGTTATLNGELNPKAALAAKDGYYFTYGSGGTCEGFTTTPGAEATGTKIEVSTPVIELEGSTEYTFCVVETNAAGESATGGPLKFKTPTTKPVIPSETAPSVTPVGATLEAKINAEKQETSYRLEYSIEKITVEKGEGTSLAEGSFSGPGLSEAQTVGPVETGAVLIPETTYYYRVVATNGTGTENGKVENFTTLAAKKPLIEGSVSTATFGQTTALLTGTVNPEYQVATKCEFQYATTEALAGTPPSAPCHEPEALELGQGGSGVPVPVHASLTGLLPNTTYYYRLFVENATGSEGSTPPEHFLTLPNPPTVATGEASAVTPNSATIAGSVNPGAKGHPAQDETTYWFQYGTNTNYSNQIPMAAGKAGEGESAVPETANLTGLEPDTTYYYRIVAGNNNAGTAQVVHGEGKTFKTIATPPVLSQVSVEGTSITQGGAVVGGLLEAMGLPTRWELRLGSSEGNLQFQAAGHTTSSSPLGLIVNVESLAPGTTYYYRLIAVNPDGESPSSEGKFTTLPGPPTSSTTQIPTTPLLKIPNNTFPEEEKEKTGKKTTKKLTNNEKLEKALEACKKESKGKRATCKKQAHRKYGPKPKKKHKK